MDAWIEQEFDTIKNKLTDLDSKLYKSTRDSKLQTYTVVGFTIFMLGIAVWVQEGMLTSVGNFFVIYGGVLMFVSIYLIKKTFTKSAKWRVAISAIILIGILEAIKYVLTILPTA